MDSSKTWIETISGKKLDLVKPNPKSICIEDIACALSKTARFNGHTKGLLSVAYHCLNEERLLREWGQPVSVRMKGLMHDAAEFACHDVASPWKDILGNYRVYEDRMFEAIMEGLGLNDLLEHSEEDDVIVKKADQILLITERRDFKAKTNYHYHKDHCPSGVKPLKRKLKPMGWRAAEKKFLKMYWKLRGQL